MFLCVAACTCSFTYYVLLCMAGWAWEGLISGLQLRTPPNSISVPLLNSIQTVMLSWKQAFKRQGVAWHLHLEQLKEPFSREPFARAPVGWGDPGSLCFVPRKRKAVNAVQVCSVSF